MKKKTLKLICIELGLLLVQTLLSNIVFFEKVYPAGLPFAMVRICYGFDLRFVAFDYLLSKALLFKNFNILFETSFEIVILSLYYFAKEFIKTKKERLMLCVFVGFSTALNLYFNFSTLQSLVLYFVGFLTKILLAVYFYKFFKDFKTKFFFYKFSNLDYFVFSVMTLLLTMGAFGFLFIQKYLGLFLVVELVIVSCKILPTEKFLMFSSVLALGVSVALKQNIYVIFLMIAPMILVNFKDYNKYLYSSIISVLLLIFVVCFKLFDIFSYFSCIFAIFCFVLIPNKWFVKLSSLFEQNSLNLICSQHQNAQIEQIKSKLFLMSDTLLDMKSKFKLLMVGKIDRQKASLELSEDIINKACKQCENFRSCFMGNINKRDIIENLLLKAIEKGKISPEDATNGFQTYCMKSGILINEINQTAKLYLGYEQAMKTEDSSKLVISSELENFSAIFDNFAKSLNNSQKINKNMSKIIKEKCLNSLVETKEVVVFENEKGVESINVVAENELLLKRDLLQIIQNVVKNKVTMKNVKHLEMSGLGIASFVPASKMKIGLAISTKAKEQKNGDNVVVSKLTEGKYFFALSDGMGHGEKANQISSMVLNLIKSMFEVGLDDELIVQSINKLLIPIGLENFTTLDAVVIDANNETCNFIKLGSSVSVIKHKNTSEVVVSDSLPLGIVQNIKPTIIRKHISVGDMIFLASDGVVDSFFNVQEYKNLINDAKIFNLQKFVDDLISDASFQNKKYEDDMTVIAVNLLKN